MGTTVDDPRRGVNTNRTNHAKLAAVTRERTCLPHEEAQGRAAFASLEGLRHQGESPTDATKRIAGGSAAPEAERTADRADVWGRRIGRALSLAALAALCIHLNLTYGR